MHVKCGYNVGLINVRKCGGSIGSIRGNKEKASKVLYIYFSWRDDHRKQRHTYELSPRMRSNAGRGE
jgi:hypothetical protein